MTSDRKDLAVIKTDDDAGAVVMVVVVVDSFGLSRVFVIRASMAAFASPFASPTGEHISRVVR
jgi:S1-C subfamily serine protease